MLHGHLVDCVVRAAADSPKDGLRSVQVGLEDGGRAVHAQEGVRQQGDALDVPLVNGVNGSDKKSRHVLISTDTKMHWADLDLHIVRHCM